MEIFYKILRLNEDGTLTSYWEPNSFYEPGKLYKVSEDPFSKINDYIGYCGCTHIEHAIAYSHDVDENCVICKCEGDILPNEKEEWDKQKSLSPADAFLEVAIQNSSLNFKDDGYAGNEFHFLTQRIIDILNPDDYKEQEKAAVREFRKKLSAYVRKLPKLTKEEIIEQIDAIPRKEVIGKDLHEYLYKNYRKLFFPKGVSRYEFNPLEYFLDTKNLKLDFTRKDGEIDSVTIMENKRSFEMRKSLKESRGGVSFSGGFAANIVYVGDLCYCLNDAVYQDAIELADPEGKFDSIASGMHVEGAFVSTDHGDGDYEGSDGRNYSVDAGIIGIVNITNASATEGEDFQSFSKLGRVIKLPKYGPTQYEISRDSAGVITVDVKQGRFTETIAIPTGFEEEYTCNECGEEISEWEYQRYGGCCESCYRESMYGSDDEEEEEFEESVINEAKSDSAFLKKAAKIAKVKIADIEYFNNKEDWMVVLDSEDSYDADSFRNAVDNLLGANSGEHSYDDVEGLGDIHLGTAEYYEVSDDEYSDLDPSWRDKVVVYCESAKKYKRRREMDW